MKIIPIQENATNCIAIIGYGLLIFWGIVNHEMWMDESHHWLVARESIYLTDLFENYRYDGHPILWGFLMWIVGKFSVKVIFVQILHACIAICMAGLFLIKAPFQNRYKILFLFTYYPLFEYSIISRNYSLTFLFLFLFCITYQRNKPVFLPLLFLALAANTHLFGLLLSFLIFLSLIFFEKKTKDFIPATFVFIMLLTFAMITIMVPDDHVTHFNVIETLDFNKVSTLLPLLWKALFPLPDLYTDHLWNTNLFTTHFKWIMLLPVLFCWALPLFLFRSNFLPVMLFYGFAIVMLTFCLITGLPLTQRISGFLLFTLIMLLWLGKQLPQINYPFKIKFKISRTLKSGALILFFSIQLIAATTLFLSDVNRPFSNTPTIFNFLKHNNLTNHPVFGGPYCNYIGLNNYGNISLFIKNLEEVDKFCDWKILHSNNEKTEVADAIHQMNNNDLKELVLLSAKAIDVRPFEHKYTIQLLATWNNGIVKNENGYLYLIKRNETF